jgi:prephenate dehydrogenase (NADP+)
MGAAWRNMGGFPWENTTYFGGIDNVKILTCLRIFSGKPHVYSGLAIHNSHARKQIEQYAKSVSELFGLMIQEDERQLRERICKASGHLFSGNGSPILLNDKVMGEYALGTASDKRSPNSHLSLLSMADAWREAGINPYENMICQTPVFRLRLGIVEYLLKNPELLEESIQTALCRKEIRRDDLEFHTAVREWSTTIGNGDAPGYRKKFEDAQKFFGEDRLKEGKKKSDELIERLKESPLRRPPKA